MIKYYIYHIPTFLHKDGRIGKIGCTVQQVKDRVKFQGYTDFEILEQHTDIMIASDREIELQKEYGYPVDKIPYYKVYKQRMKTQPTPEQRRKGSIKSGNLAKENKTGIFAITKEERAIIARRALLNQKHEDKVKGGILGGKIAKESGQIYALIEKSKKPVIVYKLDGTFVGEYESIADCSRKLNLHLSSVNRVANNVMKQTKGYIVKFKSTEDGI
jgi:hypothetical protein